MYYAAWEMDLSRVCLRVLKLLLLPCRSLFYFFLIPHICEGRELGGCNLRYTDSLPAVLGAVGTWSGPVPWFSFDFCHFLKLFLSEVFHL